MSIMMEASVELRKILVRRTDIQGGGVVVLEQETRKIK